MAYGKPNMTKHAIAFPSKVLAGSMGAHIYNITLTTAADNGNVIGRGAWNSFDNYAEAAAPNGITGKIVDKAANGHWYVEITAVPAGAEALVVYNSPIIPYESPRELADLSNFWNDANEVVKAYVCTVGDIWEVSDEGFSGTPAKNKTLTVASKKWVVGA